MEQAPEPAPPQDESTGELVEMVLPCEPGSPEQQQARDAVLQLTRRVHALGAMDDPKPSVEALNELLSSRCFRIAGPHLPSLEAVSAVALKKLWENGAEGWLHHYLMLGGWHSAQRGSPRLEDRIHTVVPPAMRTTLSIQTHPNHPLRHLLCSLKSAPCDVVSSGWTVRAERAFEAFAEHRRLEWRADHSDHGKPASKRECAERAQHKPVERYEEWRICVDELPLRVAALPLGGLKAPRDGWLVIRGRRGHYGFCDELRAYDLATGAAYMAQSCGRLALQQDGSVIHGQTDAGRKVKPQAGRLPLANLREAAWMTLLSPLVQGAEVRWAEYFELPEDVKPQRRAHIFRGFGISGFSTSSAQTRLSWTYWRAGRTLASGTLTWPNDFNDAAREHAVQLIRIAESAFEPRCPPARLPHGLDFSGKGSGVSHLDADRESLDLAHEQLVEGLAKLRRGRVCPLHRP